MGPPREINLRASGLGTAPTGSERSWERGDRRPPVILFQSQACRPRRDPWAPPHHFLPKTVSPPPPRSTRALLHLKPEQTSNPTVRFHQPLSRPAPGSSPVSADHDRLPPFPAETGAFLWHLRPIAAGESLVGLPPPDERTISTRHLKTGVSMLNHEDLVPGMGSPPSLLGTPCL